jgi:hypothetical protein
VTLVVARSFASQIRMTGDSQISDLNAINRGTARGALKTVIVDQNLAIAFAGNLGRAQLALEAIRDSGGSGTGPEGLLTILETFCREGDGDTEFLMMALAPSAEIMKVTAAGFERALPSAWIGDLTAYEAYQRLYHSAADGHDQADGDLPAIGRMITAFSELLRIGDVAGIGPPEVTIKSTAQGFRYAPSATVSPIRQTIPAGATVQIRFGTAAEGGYGHSVLVPEEIGIGAIGVHFFPGQLGVLYYPLRLADPIVYRDVAPGDFVEAIQTDIGVTLSGLFIG